MGCHKCVTVSIPYVKVTVKISGWKDHTIISETRSTFMHNTCRPFDNLLTDSQNSTEDDAMRPNNMMEDDIQIEYRQYNTGADNTVKLNGCHMFFWYFSSC